MLQYESVWFKSKYMNVFLFSMFKNIYMLRTLNGVIISNVS